MARSAPPLPLLFALQRLAVVRSASPGEGCQPTRHVQATDAFDLGGPNDIRVRSASMHSGYRRQSYEQQPCMDARAETRRGVT